MTPQEIKYVFHLGLEKFVLKSGDTWDISQPIGPVAIRHYLVEEGRARGEETEPKVVDAYLKEQRYTTVRSHDIKPNAPPLYKNQHGQLILNIWVPPTITPAPDNPYPRIAQLLDWTTDNDAQGRNWLEQWMAWKIQNPENVPKVAVVLTGSHGSGKGTLGFLMRTYLGPKNCAVIQRGALESRFNARWVGKLFAFADEIADGENLMSISDKLKVLIDGDELELEGKGTNQRDQRNRLAWMFATNDRVAPLHIEKGDRRYTVFSNHNEVTPEYRQTLLSCFQDQENATPTESFYQEMQGFFHYLQTLQVDRQLINRPYDNKDRAAFIEANLPAHDHFFKLAETKGITPFLEAARSHGRFLMKDKDSYDFGPDGLSVDLIYAAYEIFCTSSGFKGKLRAPKFANALRSHLPRWKQTRPDAYVLPSV